MGNACVSTPKKLPACKTKPKSVVKQATKQVPLAVEPCEPINPYVYDVSPYGQPHDEPVYEPIQTAQQPVQDPQPLPYLSTPVQEQAKKSERPRCKPMCPLGHPSINYQEESVKGKASLACLKCKQEQYRVRRCGLCNYQLCAGCSEVQDKNTEHNWKFKYVSIYAGYGFSCHKCRKPCSSVVECTNCNTHLCPLCNPMAHSSVCSKPTFRVRKEYFRCCFCYKNSVTHLHCQSCNAVCCGNCVKTREALRECEHSIIFKHDVDFCLYCNKQDEGFVGCSKCQLCMCLQCYQNKFQKE